MEDVVAILLVIVAGLLGLLAGYFFGKSRAYQNTDLSSQVNLMAQLNTQLAEIKTQFNEIEKRRQEIDKEREKTTEEREKRWQQFVATIQNTMQGMTTEVNQFQRLMLGTKQRGQSGEALLKEYLKEPIKAGFIKTNLNTGNGVVEFALDLGDGKFIPIDSKLPDVYELVDKFQKSTDHKEQLELKKLIKRKIENAIDEVTEYINQPKTIDRCVLAVPDNLVDMYPEMVDRARERRIYLVGYSFAYLLAYLLYEEYQRYKAEGDLGEYKKNIKVLLGIIDEIHKRTETIDRGVKMIHNANLDISDSTRQAKKLT